MLPYYAALARQSFRTSLTYRSAAYAGVLTNAFFGMLFASTYIALFHYRSHVAGYTIARALQYIWFSQAMLSVVALWGWWEIALSIRSGDIVTDLARPADYYLSWLSRDLGRAAYQVLFRGLPMIATGVLLYRTQLPALDVLPILGLSLVLAVVVSFAWRFLLNLSAFWLMDVRGMGLLGVTLATFFAGFNVPVAFFPSWLHTIAVVLPFGAFLTVPSDIYLGRLNGWQVVPPLLSQLVWALAMSTACYALLARARLRLEVQGG